MKILKNKNENSKKLEQVPLEENKQINNINSNNEKKLEKKIIQNGVKFNKINEIKEKEDIQTNKNLIKDNDKKDEIKEKVESEKDEIISDKEINDDLNGNKEWEEKTKDNKIKELLNKILILEKENCSLKEENELLRKENSKIKEENKSLKNEIKSIEKKNTNLIKEKNSKEANRFNKKNDIKNIDDNFFKIHNTINKFSHINSKENLINENNINDLNKEKDNGNEIINIESNINFQSKSPINLKIFKTLSQSSFTKYSLDNTFDAFTTISGELLLVYSTKFKSIECFDIVRAKYIKTVLNAHNSLIIIIKHYCPNYLNKDLILSSSNNPDYTIKIWDIENWTCIINITKIYEKGNMLATCLHFDEYQKESYIFTSSDCGHIKIWDKDGKYLTTINKTENNETYFLDTYYDETEFKYFLISGEMKCVKSYDLNTHQLFRTYIDNNSYVEHLSAFVYKNSNITELVECEFYGFVRIWNFYSGNLIRKIEICKKIPLVSMCLWNEEFLLISCVDGTIKLIDFKNYEVIKSFSGHNNEVSTIKKIIHPTYGECLISEGLANDEIKMWVIV